jgi:hypothetical protein
MFMALINVFVLFLLLLVKPNQQAGGAVLAAACGSCNVTVSGNQINYTATGCTPRQTYRAELTGSAEFSDSQQPRANTEGAISGSFVVSSPGEYSFGLGEGLLDPYFCTKTASVTTEPPSEYECGDQTSGPDDICPANCPNSDSNGNGGTVPWWCSCGLLGKGCCKTTSSAGVGACNNNQLTCNNGICENKSSKTTSARISGDCNDGFISTAIGCIPFGSSSALVTFFVSWGLGIGGGVAMLSLIYAGFMTMTSAGDPKRLEMGKELVVSSLSGIVLLAFSIFVLRLIGVDILGLFA